MMKPLNILALSLSAAALLCSCEHKELCLDHEDHALSYAVELQFAYDQLWHEDYSYYNDPMVEIDGGWVVDATERYDQLMPELMPGLPGGIRGVVFAPDGNRHTYNFPTTGGTLPLSRGEHQMLFYNNDSEYIVINDDDAAAEITISTRSRNRSSYHGSPFVDTGTRAENTVAAPDMLYFGYVDRYQANTASATPDTLTVKMRPLVCTYVIVFNFDSGGEYVALARGALAGMAGSVKLYNGETPDDDVATVLFDCELLSEYAQAVVNTFGVPGYQLQSTTAYTSSSATRADHTYGLNLELRLVNGNIITYDFDVTDQVALQPQGGVITIDGIVINKEDATSSGSGFDVKVDGWGEYQDYVLPI